MGNYFTRPANGLMNNVVQIGYALIFRKDKLETLIAWFPNKENAVNICRIFNLDSSVEFPDRGVNKCQH